MKQTYILLGFCVLLLCGSMVTQIQFDRTMNYDAAYNVHLNIPSAKYVKLLAFGFHDLLADFIYLWSIQFFSSYNIHNMFDFMEPVFNLITDLSPKYSAPYKIGASIMANEAHNIPLAIKLLKKGAKQFPADWIFYFDIAFYYYKNLNDLDNAKYYFHLAAQVPDAPAMIKLKEAHVIYLKANSREAYQMWLDIYNHAKEDIEKVSAFNHLYQLKYEIDAPILMQFVSVFKEKYGHLPNDLQQLVEKKLIVSVPVDFAGNNYQYDSLTGKITTKRKYKAWKKSS